MVTHLPLPKPIPVIVRGSFLHDGALNKPSVSGLIIEFTSYADQVLTATVLLSNGAVFYHLPFHAFFKPGTKADRPKLETCYYENTGKGPAELFCDPTLKSKEKCRVFRTKTDRQPVMGKYLYTVDWLDDNRIQHIIELVTGVIVAVPNHKVLFNTKDNFLPDYKKSHLDFRFEKKP